MASPGRHPRSSSNVTLTENLASEVSSALGYYVYALVDPRDGEIFYVGKGKGSRFLAHEREAVNDQGRSDKQERIRSILADGCTPRIDIIRHGLPDDNTAYLVEGAVIDALAPGLTNAVAGHGDGRLPLDELKVRYAAPDLPLDAPPALMIRLSNWTDKREEIEPGYFRSGSGWRPDITTLQLADATRAWWRVSPASAARRKATHAVAVHNGVTRGVFAIDGWTKRADGRHAFRARPVLDGPLQDSYVGAVGKRLPAARGSQNPVTYWPPR